MGAYALAIDLGASSGRLILGSIDSDKITLREVDRFPNCMQQRGSHTCWDMEALLAHIRSGLVKCAALGCAPATLGIDTWGVDYTLIGTDGKSVYDAVAYRDARTEPMPALLDRAISAEALYARTGIARQSYNTVYQLMAELAEHPALHGGQAKLLFTPCYLSYRLCGVARNEYSIASTSGLLNAATRTWDAAVLAAAGIPAGLLGDAPAAPGTRLGTLLPAIAKEVGFACEVILPATHDTASAYLAALMHGGGTATLSSGTWSLLGMELAAPLLSDAARQAGFTNEGGYGGQYTFLRNIMGLWMLQSIRREWGERCTYAQMSDMALRGQAYNAVFDAADERFLAPQSMVAEIKAALREAGAPMPEQDDALLYCVHHSLAHCYAKALQSLTGLTGQPVNALHIVGGGCQNRVLNQLTADVAGIRVLAGPLEATAIGNLVAQWLATGEVESLADARALIQNSAMMETYLPRG